MANDRFLQRYGGHLVLVVIAALLIIGTKALGASEWLSFERGAEPATPRTVGTEATIADEQDGAPVSVEATPEFDMSTLPIQVDNSLSPAPIPVTYRPKKPEHSFITYTVQSGDTAIRIAERFGISEETILGGNSFLSNDAGQLMAGVTITILLIDGVLHDVVEGDTLEGIAAQYDVPVEDIIAYEPNSLEFPYRLFPGTQILVPGAVRDVFFWEPPNVAVVSGSGSSNLSDFVVLVPGTGTFVWPVGGRRITQYYWYGHQAVDIGLVTGTPVYASDTGTVTYAQWSPHCYGNLIVINHGNGYETYYAHLDGFNVTPGQTAYQGSLIGWSGNTGCSSGPHLHFEIRYSRSRYDPLSYLP
jgi:murein DD-endopeptidase MepM/ murein hydrolase activator NlpD